MNASSKDSKSGKMSFRTRMVVFSVLVSAIGLFGFALLAVGFFERELNRNLRKDLWGVLRQSAPVLLRTTEGRRQRVEDWMAARLEGRLDQFGAVYAVRRFDRPEWVTSSKWPEQDGDLLDRLVRRLPETTFPRSWDRPGRPFAERLGEGASRIRRDGRPPGEVPGAVRTFQPEDWPGEWMVAGLRSDEAALLLAVPRDRNRGELRRLIAVMWVAGPLALLLVGAGAFFLAGRALEPIRRLTELAGSVTATDLSQRIGSSRMEREFGELIDVFNDMLDRLETSFRQARRFGQDAAHELNTPLTILTARIDEALTGAPMGSPEQVQLAEIGEELSRMKEIVRKLELLARIDGGGFRPARERFDLNATCRETVAEIAEIHPDIRFECSLTHERDVLGDPGLVRQILLNLLGNAARYNRKDGSVTVRTADTSDRIGLTVLNTGPAIPDELAARVFDRFSRGDPARGRVDGGLGLGLSLAREFALAMGGDLGLSGTGEDSISFKLVLPAAPEHDDEPTRQAKGK